MNTTLQIAKKDFSDALRSRRYWVLVATVFCLPTFIGLLFVTDMPSSATAEEKATTFLNPMSAWFRLVIPFLATALGYRAIAGARESGSLRLLFGMSTTRHTIFTGKLLGRSAVLLVSLLIGFAGLGAIHIISYGFVELGLLALTTGIVLGYGLVWLAMAIRVSAAVSTQYRAMTALFSLALWFVFLWREIALRLLSIAFEGNPVLEELDDFREATDPSWYVYGNRLSPNAAFEGLSYHLNHILLDGKFEAGGSDPNLFGAGVLVAWAVAFLAIGYWRFQRTDLANTSSGGIQDYATAGLSWLRKGVSELTNNEPKDKPAETTATLTAQTNTKKTANKEPTPNGGTSASGTIDPSQHATGKRRQPPLGLPVLSVAKKEFADAIRSKLLWSISAFFFTIVALEGYFTLVKSGQDKPIFFDIADTMELVVPFIALVLGYRAIVGERESGSLRLLMSTPVTRRDVALGKYLGRLTVMATILTSGMLLIGSLYLWQFDHLTVNHLLLTTALILIYGIAWLGIAIGASSFARSGALSAATIFSAFALFNGLWELFIGRVLGIIFTGSQHVDANIAYDATPTWFAYIHRLNPAQSYRSLNVKILDINTENLSMVPDDMLIPNLFGIAMLLAWASIPILLGYWRFTKQDIN